MLAQISNYSYFIDERQREVLEDITPAFPFCMHTADLAGAEFPWHWHEELELGYVESGEIKLYAPEMEYQLHAEDVFFISCNLLHKVDGGDRGLNTREFVTHFHEILLYGYYSSIFDMKYSRLIRKNHENRVMVFRKDTENGKKMLEILKKIRALKDEEDKELFVRNYLSEAWYIVYKECKERAFSGDSMNFNPRDRILIMVKYIGNHCGEKITLEDIAGSANISTREATRCFKASMGQTPIEYLTMYRLNNTQKLLVETKSSITEIALQNGFTDNAYFSKTFKKHFGMSPSAYREKNRKKAD